MHVTSLEDLFVEQLSHLYDVEKQILKALPLMAKAARSERLRGAFEEHYEQTREHVERLENIFDHYHASPKNVTDMAIRGLLAEGKRLMAEHRKSAARDAGLIAAAQKVEHFEIAGYGTARTYADMLGYSEAASLLNATIKEEGLADKRLTGIAESGINLEARMAGFPASVARQGGSVRSEDGGNWVFWLLGLGAGAALAMAFAPQAAGARRQIRDAAARSKDYVTEQAGALRDSASDLIDRGREMIGRQRETPSGANL